jgi:predicted ATPase
MAEGLSNEGIAKRNHLSLKTIESVSRAIFLKLGLVEESRIENRRVKAILMFLEDSVDKGGIPIPATRFVGREQLLSSVRSALLNSRCITLTGLGGVGKTRVAIELGLERYARGEAVSFVNLVGSASAHSVDAAFMEAFGVTDIDRLDRAVEKVRGTKELLVVVDNAEEVGSLAIPHIEALLRHHDVRVLVTSRLPLRRRFETVIRVPVLSVDDVIALLTARSGVTLGEPEAKVLGEAVGGLPLALEMLAPRLRNVGAEELIARLGNNSEVLDESLSGDRHDNLADVLNSTMRLLPTEVARSLRRLSVIPGGFELDLAAAVVGSEQLLATVALLADMSLIEFDRVRRYRVLEPIRQIAFAQLRVTGEEKLCRERLLAWVVDLTAGNLNPGNTASKSKTAASQPVPTTQDRFAANRLAISAALQIALDDGDTKSALRILGSAGSWLSGSFPSHWLPYAEKAIANASSTEDHLLVGGAEFTAGLLAAAAHNDRCEDFFERAEHNLRLGGDLRQALRAQFWLLNYNGGNEELFERAIAVAEELKDLGVQAKLWAARSHHAFIRGVEFGQLEPWFLRAVELGRRSSRGATFVALQNLVFRRLEASKPLVEIVPLLEEAELLLDANPHLVVLSELERLRAQVFMRTGNSNAAREMFLAAYVRTAPSENATTKAFITLFAVDALAGIVAPSIIAECLVPVVWFLNARWDKAHPTLVAKNPQLAFSPKVESSLKELNASALRVQNLLRDALALKVCVPK